MAHYIALADIATTYIPHISDAIYCELALGFLERGQ
jgi:hypothetical protein